MEKGLKYVVLVVTVAFRAIECFFNVYGYAKDRSGPLKPVLETVEGTAKSVAAPLYNKFNDVQIEALKFVTMDESLIKIDHHVPPTFKQAILSTTTYCTEKYNEIVKTTVEKGYKVSSYLPLVATEKICKVFSKEKIENQLPIFSHIMLTILLTAAYCTEKYNETMRATKEDYKVAPNLPLVSTQSIAKMFNKDKFKIEPLVG